MKQAKYHAIERYGWECPYCEEWNEEDDDPSYKETVYCTGCTKESEPVPD